MRLSCLPVSFFQPIMDGSMRLRDWVRAAREAGLDGLDLSVILLRNHTPVHLQEAREELASEGLPVIMITTYPDFTHPDPAQRAREAEYLRHDIALCSQLGARYLRILAGQAHPGVTVEQGVGWVLAAFEEAAAVAARFGITLLFENHSRPGAWALFDFSHPTAVFLRIARQLRGTPIRINFDTGNTLVYGDDPLPVLDEVLDQVETVHAADTAEAGRLAPCVIGRGCVPFREIFARLKRGGFDGWICIEEASRTGLDGVRQAAAFVRQTWADA